MVEDQKQYYGLVALLRKDILAMRMPDNVPWCSTGYTLGSGGQGEVQLVNHRDEPGGPKYALKVLRNVNSQQAWERFRREIEVVKNMNHPAIVRVIDQSEPTDPFQFYVMEYYQGAKTLDKLIFSGSNPFHGNALQSLELFEQIIYAISACEAALPQIVHRDINPKNILILPDGTIRLIDFGICQIQDGTMITLIDEDVGTRNYTSPECEAGNDGDVGVHSDMYSAGKVLWSVITSQRAFAREAPAFGARSMQQMFPRRSETWHLVRLFEKTIRSRIDDRFRRTSDLLDRIRDVRYVIQRGYPPIEEVDKRCPSCGWTNLIEFPQGHIVFGNPNPSGVFSLICNDCGFGFIRNENILRRSIESIQSLN